MIKWDQSFSVGVKLIDLQHQKLFEILNNVEETLKRDSQNFAALEDIIHDLQTYVEFHFSEEQNYFDKFHYEETVPHEAQHVYYINKIREFHDSCDKQEEGLSQRMLDFIEAWIKEHINHADKKYRKCFNDHGLV